MPFILLKIAMQAVEPASATRPDLSEAPENLLAGPPEMSDRRGGGFQMQGLKSETGLRAGGENARATQCAAMTGSLLGDKESN
jgi:hypothetical protein